MRVAALKLTKNMTVEQLYPSARCRAAAYAAVDALPVSATIAEALDAFDQAYVDAGGRSPWRA